MIITNEFEIQIKDEWFNAVSVWIDGHDDDFKILVDMHGTLIELDDVDETVTFSYPETKELWID